MKKVTAGLAGLAAAELAARGAPAQQGIKIGMCDWSMGKRANVEAVALAREIGLDGIQVSLGQLRDDPAVLKRYLDDGKKYNIKFPSLALGVLNSVPLATEPRAAVWVDDAIEVSPKMGAKCILLAFFGRGEIKMDRKEDVKRIVDVLKLLAPRAEKNNVILGLENTLSAEDNLRILDQVDHPYVQVYYDFKNSANRGRDVIAEVRKLGKERICEVHLKNGRDYMEKITNVNWPAVAEVMKEIGYDGWYILETSSPSKNVVDDTKRNLEYVRKVFG